MSATIILLWNGRKKTVRTSANTLMKAILEEACLEFGINSNSFTLQHKKKNIDLSQPFRYTGISQNATVDVVEANIKTQNVLIGISLPNGGRLQSNFSPDVSLSAVLHHFISEESLSGEILEQQPSLVFMRNSFPMESLPNTTLRSLGLSSGSARFTLILLSGSPPATMGEKEDGLQTSTSLQDSSISDMKIDNEPASNPESECSIPAASPKSENTAMDVQNIEVEDTKQSSFSEEQEIAQSTNETKPPEEKEDEKETVMDVDSAKGEEKEDHTFLGDGMDGVRASIEAIRANHFDSDASQCILTLMKYTINLLNKPGDPLPRKIKCGNPTFGAKVAAFRGGVAFLRAIGYQHIQEGLSHEIAKDPLGHSFLVFENENKDLLQKAYEQLIQEADSLGIAPETRPKQKTCCEPSIATNFDPFKSHFFSTVPTITKGDREPSVTERKLNELKAKHEQMQGGIPERNLQIFSPDLSTASQGSGQSFQASNEGMEPAAAVSDSKLLQQKLSKQLEQQRRNEQVPFKTKAMRELEQLEKARVYTHTVIRVQFPDRTILQACFHPRENINAVAALVRQNLTESAAQREFLLYVSPPKVILQGDQILAEAMLVPAALVYLSWKDSAFAETKEPYLKEVQDVKEFEAIASPMQYPSSKPLVGDVQENKEVGSPEAKTTQIVTADSSKNAKEHKSILKNKPAWFKL